MVKWLWCTKIMFTPVPVYYRQKNVFLNTAVHEYCNQVLIKFEFHFNFYLDVYACSLVWYWKEQTVQKAVRFRKHSCTHTHTSTPHTHLHTHTHTHLHIHIHKHTLTHTITPHTHTYIHTSIHTHNYTTHTITPHTHTHTHTHNYTTHTHTYIHTQLHHTHTQLHHTQLLVFSSLSTPIGRPHHCFDSACRSDRLTNGYEISHQAYLKGQKANVYQYTHIHCPK